MKNIKRLLLLFLSLQWMAASAANEAPVINGFLTVGVGALSSDDVTLQGFDEDLGYREDAIFGLQITQKLTDEFSLTGQVVGRGNESFEADVAWAYVTYAYSPETQIRMGRLRMPLFHYSDQQEVGYSYLWIRPPVEVYQFPFTSMEMISANHFFETENGNVLAEVYTGRVEDEIRGLPFTVKNSVGLIVKYMYRGIELRGSMHRGTTTQEIEGSPLEPLPALDSAFKNEEFSTRFYTFSALYPIGSYFGLVEWMRVGSNSAFSVKRQGYLAQIGKYFDNAAIHLTYSGTEADPESGSTGQLQSFLVNEEESITAGLRYELDEGIALKFEIQHHNEKIAAGQPGKEAMLYSTALDMVF